METRKYVTNSDLPMFWEDERLDVWWNKVFKSSRLPVLSSLVHPLSILTRPTAECSFNIMNDIIDRMEINTCSAIMTT